MGADWVLTYIVAFFVTRSTFDIYRNMPGQINQSEKCIDMAKEMDGWDHGELVDIGYSAQEISDWFWTIGILHRMGYSNGGYWRKRYPVSIRRRKYTGTPIGVNWEFVWDSGEEPVRPIVGDVLPDAELSGAEWMEVFNANIGATVEDFDGMGVFGF